MRTLRLLALFPLFFRPGDCIGQSRYEPALSIRFRAEVHRAENFEREIGRGLVFRLVPDEYGWSVEVGPKDSVTNYMDCVNGPLHGITPFLLEGWLFRNDDNTAPRKASAMLTPGIGAKHEFQFVLTANDEAKACADLEKTESNLHGRLAFIDRSDRYAGGDGALTINHLALGNLQPGLQAWIESMGFDATFSFRIPAAAKH